MEDMKCWDLKENCMMRGEDREDASCPAYRQGVGCWDVGWSEIVSTLPSSQIEYWYMFLEKCSNCVAYKAHPHEMQARIDAVMQLRVAD
ncbi:MAG: hypothetical protein ACYCXF_00925 [Thermoleophilia bacterium]